MKQLNDIFSIVRTMQRVFKIKDSIAVSLFSGFLGTLVMDALNYLFWKNRKTEALYGHIAGSVYVRPFRTNQRKNFWLGQITHHITGAALAIPLTLILKKTGKDYLALKGAFFGSITWELIYGMGQRFSVFSTKPHMTKTHFAELFNNTLYGITTAYAIATFSEPSAFLDIQSKTTDAQNKQNNTIQPIYSDTNYNVENSDAYGFD
ncbi:MAG: hypothetical protein Q8912_13450 [Bacillota bacterium]|nr:hypothetical protein [Bacillota bacterium]